MVGSPRPQPAELGIRDSINGPGVHCAGISPCGFTRGGKQERAEDRVVVTEPEAGAGWGGKRLSCRDGRKPKGWWCVLPRRR